MAPTLVEWLARQVGDRAYLLPFLNVRQPIRFELSGFEDLDPDEPDFDSKLSSATVSAIEAGADTLTKALMKGMPRLLKRQRGLRSGFEKRLSRIWGPALNGYDLLWTLSVGAGSRCNTTYRPRAAEKQDYVFDALSRLHGRACLTASEIGALLRSGHPTGAHARWRTLNELAVVSLFLGQHGNEVAERYIRHDMIGRYRLAKAIRPFSDRYPEDAPSDAEWAELVRQRDLLVARYGGVFERDYGWAAAALHSDRPSFRLLADAIDMGHWAPYFRMASEGVHAGAHGAFFDMGTPPHLDVIAAGPSQLGLADAGGDAAISLMQATIALLGHVLTTFETESQQSVELEESLSIAVEMRTIQRLAEKVSDAFLAIHHGLDQTAFEPRAWEPIVVFHS